MSQVIMFIVLYGVLVVTQVCGELNPYARALEKRPWQSEQQYVEVRPGAFLFYWLYFADGVVSGAHLKPLVIWIQGGPGLAASGVANFAEIGPLNMNMEPRNHTWVKGRNVLLIDHPVGTGFSYVLNNSLLVKSDREIAYDLSRVIKSFLKRHKEFRQTPTYIFGQSYGGKIAPRLAYYLHSAIKNNKLKMNLKGIGIGSGWVNPKESTLLYSQYLYIMGLIDYNTYIKTTALARLISEYIDRGDFTAAQELDMIMHQTLIHESALEVNFNNIYKSSPYPELHLLAVKINRYVKPLLRKTVNQSMKWNYISMKVYDKLKGALLVPSTKFLELLLNETKINIAVYNGNLDVVTPLAGASNWIHKLKWHGAEEFMKTQRFKIQGENNGFYKSARQLSLWGVFGAGHWVPEDNPDAMENILNYLIEN